MNIKNYFRENPRAWNVVAAIIIAIAILVAFCKNKTAPVSSQKCDTCINAKKTLEQVLSQEELLNQIQEKREKACKTCPVTTPKKVVRHTSSSRRQVTYNPPAPAPVPMPSPCTVNTTTVPSTGYTNSTSTNNRGGVVPAVRQALLARYNREDVHTFIGNIRYSQYLIALNPGSVNDTIWFPFTPEGKAQALEMINKSGRRIIAGNLASDANLAAAAKDPNFHYR